MDWAVRVSAALLLSTPGDLSTLGDGIRGETLSRGDNPLGLLWSSLGLARCLGLCLGDPPGDLGEPPGDLGDPPGDLADPPGDR